MSRLGSAEEMRRGLLNEEATSRQTKSFNQGFSTSDASINLTSNDLGKGSSVYRKTSNQDILASLRRMALAKVCSKSRLGYSLELMTRQDNFDAGLSKKVKPRQT